MRQADREIKDRKAIDDIIRRAAVCRLGLVDGDEPYVVPLNYGYDGSSLYFHCAREGRKLDIIRRNNKACFQMDTDLEFIRGEPACRWTMRYRSVMGTGKAFLIDDLEEKRKALDLIMAHYTEGPFEYADKGFDLTLIIRLDIESITGKRSKY